MAKEEFTLRITKKGDIMVETDKLPPRRVKDLIKFLEETIGPATLIDVDGRGASGGVTLEEVLTREQDREETETEEVAEENRLRLRFRRL